MFELDWPAWVLLGGGLLVVVLEIFFASAGILALLALACFVAGGWFAFDSGGMAAVGGYSLVALLLIPVALLGALKILPRTPMGRRMQLAGPTVSVREAGPSPLDAFVGRDGLTVTALRPAGIVTIDRERLHVVTRSTFIEAGMAVRVVKVEGNELVVEARSSAPA